MQVKIQHLKEPYIYSVYAVIKHTLSLDPDLHQIENWVIREAVKYSGRQHQDPASGILVAISLVLFIVLTAMKKDRGS